MTIREQLEEREHQNLSPYAVRASQSKGRRFPVEPCPVRTCFQRDVDRIVHCKSFRRLMHKTQVFLRPKGDHYHTRMTHTLEVARVARTIARGLGLNEDLTEAAALGHDFGHTPFGHTGEAVLNELLPGGFRHNEQSLRVVDRLERDGQGLNLTFEVREGILCHSGSQTAATLEGQSVRLADKIAYLSADIDDAIRGGVLAASDLSTHIVEALGTTHSERVNTFVLDILANSRNQNMVCLSPEKSRIMQELRQFMFASVYHSPVIQTEREKAQQLVKRLFAYYRADRDRLPLEFQAIWDQEGAERAVSDYIAGMTDAYAMEHYTDLFLPKGWAVL